MKLDFHIPAPDRRHGGPGKPAKYPFAEMPVGSSFALPIDHAAKVATAARIWKTRHPGWDYRTQRSADGIRVWRIE